MRVYDSNTGQWVNAPQSSGGAPNGFTAGPNGTFLRAPNQANSVEARTNSLLRSDSDLMKINEKKGQQFAAGRGLLNSSLAGQAGRQAAVSSAVPIAQADAQLQAQADSQNAETLNAAQIAELNRQAASAAANARATGTTIDQNVEHIQQMERMRLASELNITEAEADRIFRREQSGLDRDLTRGEWDWRSGESAVDRDWRSGESGADRDWRSGEGALDRDLQRTMSREEWNMRRDEQERDLGFRSTEAERDRAYDRESATRDSRFAMFRDVMGQSLGTIFSSPDFFRDPASASGFLEFFTGQFGSLFDRFFAPGGG